MIKIRSLLVAYIILLLCAWDVKEVFASTLYLSATEAITEQLKSKGIKKSQIVNTFSGGRLVLSPRDSEDNVFLCGEVQRTIVIQSGEGKRIRVSGDYDGMQGSLLTLGEPALVLKGSNIVVENIHVRADNSTGIFLRASDVVVRNVRVSGCVYGIHLAPEDVVMSNIIIKNCMIESSSKVGIVFDEKRNGIKLKNVTLKGNSVLGSGSHGIRIWFRKQASESVGEDIKIIGNFEKE